MSITINGSTNTITAPSGVTISGAMTITGTTTSAGTVSTNQAMKFAASHLGTASDYYISNYLTNLVYNAPTGGGHNWAINNGDKMALTSTGLAVTGLLDLSAASSGQIKFPASQNASADANTLDDYEEGTWTPAITGLSTAGAGTYSVQVGAYTKIGNKVTVTAFLTWSAHTGTGNIYIGGLPFTPKNTANQIYAAFVYSNNLTLTASNTAQAYINANETAIYLNQVPVGGGASSSIAMDTAASVIVTATYFV